MTTDSGFSAEQAMDRSAQHDSSPTAGWAGEPVTYADYSRDRIGWFFGISGVQLGVLVLGAAPTLIAVNRGAWAAAGLLLVGWLLVAVVTVVPVRGRSATGWLVASGAHVLGGMRGWTSFRSASRGRIRAPRTLHGAASTSRVSGGSGGPETPDLPGVLSGIQIHDGPPHGSTMTRVAIIQDHATRCWSVTAAIVHPGIGMSAAEERRRYGEGLAELLDTAGRTEKIDELIFTVRTVPEDGAERDLWVASHSRTGAPGLSTQVNADLAEALTRASVRTEQFLTVCVPESRIARSAKESGGGLEGRCREMYLLMGEVEAHLRGGLGMSSVSWLTSPELALACRTGFAPGDRAGIVAALAERDHPDRPAHQHGEQSGDQSQSEFAGGAGGDPEPRVNASVPWSMAGASGADPVVRQYSHDAWNSISATITLPAKGAVMGALAPVLTPGEAGERRSFMVSFPIMAASKADRATGNTEWAADTSEALRAKLGMRMRARQREESARARGMDAKLARGNAMTRPYAVCTVTVPKTARVSEFGRRLDASIRRAGFAPLRLDLAQDPAFAATTVPLGIGLTRRGDA